MRPASIGNWPVSSPSRSIRDRHGGKRGGVGERVGQLAAMAHAVDGLGPAPRVPGRRHHVGQDAQASSSASTPLAEQDTEIATEQGGAMEGQHRADQRQPRAPSMMAAAHACGRRSTSQAGEQRDRRRCASACDVGAQEIGERRERSATTGSSLALKSRSTVANCGSTNDRKKSSTPPAAQQHEGRIAQRIGEPAAQRLGARRARRRAPRESGRACRRPRRPAPAPHRSAGTGSDVRERLGEALAGQDRRP